MNNATLAACKQAMGDFGRFVSTAFVARDVDQILTALDEPELTGRMGSYGTGIGQTFVNMFPERVGRLILDATEYVRDHRLVGGFGWTALDNTTDAWHDGFLGECVAAGPDHCALARLTNDIGEPVSLFELEARMESLLLSLTQQPRPAYLMSSGPSLVTYSQVVGRIYEALYVPFTWPTLARALYDLEVGNATAIAQLLDSSEWEFSPPATCPIPRRDETSTTELGSLVICADSYDAPKPWVEDDEQSELSWWSDLWQNMTERSWVAGNSRFFNVFPCRHYTPNFGSAAEVYRGDLNHTLSNPVLLIAEPYDPTTPLRNGRRLLAEMGDNARLIVHHGYGHGSGDPSKCTNDIALRYMLDGTIPKASETDCFADEKPSRYSAATMHASWQAEMHSDLQMWKQQMLEMKRYRLGAT